MKEQFFGILERVWNFLFELGQRIDCGRIISNLDKPRRRFIYLPLDVNLCCSNCGELCEPKGECKLAFVPLSTGVRLMIVSCKCRKAYQPPILAEAEERIRYHKIAIEKIPLSPNG